MSRRRTIFVVMTAMSAIGFVVDRCFLSEPAGAEAAGPVRAKNAKKAPVAEKAAEESTVIDPSLSYLDKLPATGKSRDIFSMSSEMLLYFKAMQETQEKEIAKAGPQPGSVEEFALNHHLEGTYTSPAGPIAVISGEVLRPGDEIDDFRLIRVTPYSAELRRERDRVVLALPKPAANPRTSSASRAARTAPARTPRPARSTP